MKNPIITNVKSKEREIELAQTLIDITQKIIGTLDYEKVMQIISDGMSKLYGIETGAIYVLEDNNELKLAVASPPLPPEMPDSVRRAALRHHPTIESAILTKKPQVIADATTAVLSPAEKEIVDMRSLRSILYFPLLAKDKILGILILSTCNEDRTYTDEEIYMGQGIADQLSVAIENSLLHEDLKNHKENLEELVKQRTAELQNANEELLAINNDLQEKNEIINQQKEEIQATLNNLKLTQSQLIHSEKMASIGVLTSGVAHEINNPLNFIKGGYIGIKNLLNKSELKNEEKLNRFLNSIQEGIDRAVNIVKGLNEFGRNNESFIEEIDINTIIDNCLAILQNQTKNHIEILKSFSENNPVVHGNSGNLHHIFLNILTNAIQSIDEKGTINIKTEINTNDIIIEIRDTGRGIPKKILPKVLDPFFTTKDPGKGTGLGLSIAHNYIKKHKGNISIESEENKGTKVIVCLPTKQSF